MKKIAKFVFETAYGPFVAWCCTALLLFAAYAASSPLGRFGTALVNIMFVVQVIAAIVNIIAFFKSLVKHQCGRALGQFLLGLAGLFLFVLGLAFAFVAHRVVAHATSSGYAEVRSASVTNETGALEFSVEYRPAHPFLAEYDKTIVFKSGKRIGVWMDTGGAGPFAVYSLPTGEYYLVDGLKHSFIRNDYRVNVTNETVEMMTGDTFWIRIPDGTLAVVGGGGNSIEVNTSDEKYKNVESKLTSVGDSLSRRKYLGLIHPRGEFEKSDDGKDPYVGIIEPKWTAVDAGAVNLPFTLEWRDNKNRRSRQWRIATVSGKHFGLVRAREFETCFVYVGAPGVYRLHFVSKNGRMSDMFDNEYRIDANSEKVEMIVGGFLLSIPSGTVCISSFGLSEDRASLTATCENGTQIESDVCIPASEDKYQYMLVGSINHDGRFLPCH